MKNTKKLVLLALMIAQAMVLSIVESWIPLPVAIPGIKLGLANIITLIVIMFLGFREAFFVVFIRCVLTSMFTGGPTVFLFSVTGGILSLIVMAVLFKWASKKLSLIGISVAGSIMHNAGQLLTASLFMREISVFFYLPVLMVSGIIMGVLVGVSSHVLANALRKTKVFSNYKISL